MGLDHIRAEIERMRVQIKRQQKDILSLQKAGISTASAVALLERMHNKVDELIGERNRLMSEARSDGLAAYTSGKIIRGTPAHRKM
jgi:light-regulated signal transduction histidine kinase (bacteriophytochrome)